MKTVSEIQNESINLYNALKDSAIDLNWNMPDIDFGEDDVAFPAFPPELLEPVKALGVKALTSGSLNGDGSFDVLMQIIQKYLEREYKENRISGTDYAKLYIESMQLALNNASQYILQAENAAWQGRLLKAQAQQMEYEKIKSKLEAKRMLLSLFQIEAEMKKAQIEALIASTQLVATKMSLSSAYNQINVMHEQIDQVRAATKETLQDGTPVAGTLAKEKQQISKNIEQLEQQILNLIKQRDLLGEQIESQRAQTLDDRTDSAPVKGILGAQRELYIEQKEAYLTDAKTKVVKMGLDTWTTRKTSGDAIEPPVSFDVDSGGLGEGNLNAIIEGLLQHVNLPTDN